MTVFAVIINDTVEKDKYENCGDFLGLECEIRK